MGYFSNGSEGEAYQAQYCDRCVHQEPCCAVWDVHLIHNYNDCNKPDSILHLLIPRRADGLGNKQCALFYVKDRL